MYRDVERQLHHRTLWLGQALKTLDIASEIDRHGLLLFVYHPQEESITADEIEARYADLVTATQKRYRLAMRFIRYSEPVKQAYIDRSKQCVKEPNY